MLVLTRKQQQQIKIGDDITVTILRLKGNTVRVGIEAPEGVRILRAELTAPSETNEAAGVQAGPLSLKMHRPSRKHMSQQPSGSSLLDAGGPALPAGYCEPALALV